MCGQVNKILNWFPPNFEFNSSNSLIQEIENSNTDWLVDVLIIIPQHKTFCSSIVLWPISEAQYGEHTTT